MPVVPTAVVPSVAPEAASGLPYSSAAGATPDAFGVNIGQAEGRFGAQIGASADMLAQHAQKLQADVNVAHSEELFLKGDTELSNLTNTFKSLNGADRVAALPKFMDDAAAVRQKYLGMAPSPDVAKNFDQLFSRQLGYSIKDAGTAAATATRQYLADQHTAVQKSALGHIASDPQDDNRFLTNVQTGLEASRQTDDYKGAAPEVQTQHDEAFVSAAWSTRLTSMAKNDPLRARELLKANANSIDGLTQVKLHDTINQGIINTQSRVEADSIVQSGALVSGNLTNKIKSLEGYSEKPYADYKQTSSGYGTKAQPGDENIPPEQRKAVYTQRLQTELGRAANIVDTFSPGLPQGTRDALISLTYNTGSAWTSQGLGAKIRAGDFEGAKDNFAQYNQAGGSVNSTLVGRRAAEIGWFGGQPVDSGADSTTKLASALDKAKEVALKTFPDDPGNQAKYMDELQNRVKTSSAVMTSANREMQLNIRNTVQSELVQSVQGGTPPVSYDQLSLKAQQAYDLAPPALQQVFQKQMRANATADVPLTADRQSLMDTLRGESKNEPDKFMARNVTELDLTRVQKSQAIGWQQDRQKLLAQGTKMSAAMSSMTPLLNDAGIGKSATDTSRNAEYNKFSGVYEQALTAFEDQHKRPPNDKEARDIGTGLLKTIVTSPGYIYDSTDRAYNAIATKTPVTLNTTDPGAHYASLPSGVSFRGPDGKLRKKP